MKWTKDHGIIFLHELLLIEPWNYKDGSNERGNFWERISESFNQLTDISFKVTQRSVQDHYQTLKKTCKKQKREEDRQSGINPEETEVDFALADIIERFEEAQKIDASEKQKKKTEQDAAKAEDVRRKSLETFGETMKRKSNENDEKQCTSKRRNTGSETLKFLQEKTESEMAIRQQQIELRREEIRNKQEKVRNQMLYNQEQLRLQQEEQRKNNQFMLQMLQQQQQMFMNMMNMFHNKQ